VYPRFSRLGVGTSVDHPSDTTLSLHYRRVTDKLNVGAVVPEPLSIFAVIIMLVICRGTAPWRTDYRTVICISMLVCAYEGAHEVARAREYGLHVWLSRFRRSVVYRDAVETLLAMTEHSGGIGVGATLRSPRDADPDPDSFLGAYFPRGRRNRGAGSAHAQPVPATADQQAPPRMGVSPLAQVAAGEADEAGPSSPPSAASPLPVGPRPGSAPGTSAWAAVAPSLTPAYPHAPNRSPFDSANFVPLESRQSAPHSVFRPFIPSLLSWLPPPLPPASSAPSPVIGSSHRVACGPQGTRGPQLRYIGAGGSGSGGERAHLHLRGGAPPQRQPNVSVQVLIGSVIYLACCDRKVTIHTGL
jgi:hypothetical protein